MQAGDKLKAIKTLLRSGETEKIVAFATTARNAEIYVIAASYLASLNWRARPDLKSTIELFLTKAKDTERLARFQEMAAQELPTEAKIVAPTLTRRSSETEEIEEQIIPE